MKAEFYVLDTTDAAAHRLYAGGQCVNCTRQRCPACGVLTEAPEPPEMEIVLNHLG